MCWYPYPKQEINTRYRKVMVGGKNRIMQYGLIIKTTFKKNNICGSSG
jgi:hypothetical protein